MSSGNLFDYNLNLKATYGRNRIFGTSSFFDAKLKGAFGDQMINPKKFLITEHKNEWHSYVASLETSNKTND